MLLSSILLVLVAACVPSSAVALSRSAQNELTRSTRSTTFPSSKQTTDRDIAVLRRQTGQTAPANAAIGRPAVCACRHGFPQAFAMDPLPASTGGGRLNSGLVKLTCPLLVRAVDALEDEGGIDEFNERLRTDAAWRNSASFAHKLHEEVRNTLLNDEDVDAIRRKLGVRGTDAFMSAGVAGSSAGSIVDAKCLHAWLADYTFRGPTIIINGKDEHDDDPGHEPLLGRAVAEGLKMRGAETTGTEGCFVLCDPCSNESPSPPRPRNKQRLKTGKETARRRRRRKES